MNAPVLFVLVRSRDQISDPAVCRRELMPLVGESTLSNMHINGTVGIAAAVGDIGEVDPMIAAVNLGGQPARQPSTGLSQDGAFGPRLSLRAGKRIGRPRAAGKLTKKQTVFGADVYDEAAGGIYIVDCRSAFSNRNDDSRRLKADLLNERQKDCAAARSGPLRQCQYKTTADDAGERICNALQISAPPTALLSLNVNSQDPRCGLNPTHDGRPTINASVRSRALTTLALSIPPNPI